MNRSNSQLPNSCKECCLEYLCIAALFQESEKTHFQNLVSCNHAFQRGEHLRRNDTSRPMLGILKSGSAKTEMVSIAGERQITGFHLPGDLFGLGLTHEQTAAASASVVFLETSRVCLIAVSASPAGNLQLLMHELLSRLDCEIGRQQSLLMAVNHYSPEQLIVMFLLDLAGAYRKFGKHKQFLRLSMPRSDVANYLGLATETVCRVFTRLEQAGLITVKSKNIQLNDFTRLRDLLCIAKTEQKPLLVDRRSCQTCIIGQERRRQGIPA